MAKPGLATKPASSPSSSVTEANVDDAGALCSSASGVVSRHSASSSAASAASPWAVSFNVAPSVRPKFINALRLAALALAALSLEPSCCTVRLTLCWRAIARRRAAGRACSPDAKARVTRRSANGPSARVSDCSIAVRVSTSKGSPRETCSPSRRFDGSNCQPAASVITSGVISALAPSANASASKRHSGSPACT